MNNENMVPKKRILFNQPAGLGDIFFLMALAQRWNKEGHTILWPVTADYIEHQKNFPEVKFIPQEQFFDYNHYDAIRKIYEDDNYIYYPFRWADVILHGKSVVHTQMVDKYHLVKENPENWRDIKITRDFPKEAELFDKLNIKEDEQFNLINENQTRIYQKIKINVDNGLRNVFMNKIPGYNMLDWLKVMYKATEIHSVATSLLILLEKLDNIPGVKHIYKRIWNNPHSDHDYYLHKENFVWHHEDMIKY